MSKNTKVSGELVIKHAFSDQPLFQQAVQVRQRVFVEEQAFSPADEWDADDAVATHVVAFVQRKPAGTARFYPDGGWLRIGRVAVLPEFRGLGLGHAIMSYCLDLGRELGYSRSFLNAQSDKLRFYEHHGYQPVGEDFDEAGTPHRRMERQL